MPTCSSTSQLAYECQQSLPATSLYCTSHHLLPYYLLPHCTAPVTVLLQSPSAALLSAASLYCSSHCTAPVTICCLIICCLAASLYSNFRYGKRRCGGWWLTASLISPMFREPFFVRSTNLNCQPTLRIASCPGLCHMSSVQSKQCAMRARSNTVRHVSNIVHHVSNIVRHVSNIVRHVSTGRYTCAHGQMKDTRH